LDGGERGRRGHTSRHRGQKGDKKEKFRVGMESVELRKN
jgi:hypothetical protein